MNQVLAISIKKIRLFCSNVVASLLPALFVDAPLQGGNYNSLGNAQRLVAEKKRAAGNEYKSITYEDMKS